MKIVWKKGKYGFEYGYVNTIQLFCVGYDSPNKYSVISTLPSVQRGHFATSLRGSKLLSLTILTDWISRITK